MVKVCRCKNPTLNRSTACRCQPFCTFHRAGIYHLSSVHFFWYKECKENYQSVQNCCQKERSSNNLSTCMAFRKKIPRSWFPTSCLNLPWISANRVQNISVPKRFGTRLFGLRSSQFTKVWRFPKNERIGSLKKPSILVVRQAPNYHNVAIRMAGIFNGTGFSWLMDPAFTTWG